MNPYLSIITYALLAAISSVLVRAITGMDIYLITLFVLFFGAIIPFFLGKKHFEAYKKGNKKDLILLGVSQLGTWLFLYWAIILNPISMAMLLFYTSPIFVLILSSLILKEKLYKQSIIAVLIGVVGVILILNPIQGIQENISILGVLFSLIASISYAINLIISRKLRNYDSFNLSFFSHFVGFVILLIFIPFLSDFQGLEAINLGVLLIMGLLSGISYTLIYYSMKKFIAQKSSILTLSEPVFATLLGILFFQEIPTLGIILGGILILSAATLTKSIKN